MTVVRRTTRLPSSSSAGRPGTPALAVAGAPGDGAGAAAAGLRPSVVAGVAAGSPPARRRRASSSDCRLKLASCERRSSSSRLRASAASCSALVARLALATRFGLRFLVATVLLFARARVDERARARFALLFGQRAQHDAGLRRRDRRRRTVGPQGRRGGGGRLRERARPAPTSRARRLAGAEDAALDLLDDDRLAAPVRKALPHGALLDGPLQVQSRLRRRCAQGLVAAVVRFTHAFFQ